MNEVNRTGGPRRATAQQTCPPGGQGRAGLAQTPAGPGEPAIPPGWCTYSVEWDSNITDECPTGDA